MGVFIAFFVFICNAVYINHFVMYNNDSFKESWISSSESHESQSHVVDYFKELPFYNKYIEKPKIKHLKNIDLLSELPVYE